MGQHDARRGFFLLLKFSFLALLPFVLNGCLFTYLVKSGYEQAKILSDRVPIEDILKDEKTPPQVKAKLQLIQDAKSYAEKNLGFAKTDNYSTYVDLSRPYVSWIVSVAFKDKLEYKYYKYPVLGKLPYKGFFSPEEAKEEAATFDSKKYDTFVRGATAFSTLGWFEDPVLNTMLRGDDADTVELILHESAHATLFIKSNGDFNEQLATFLGQEATRRYFLHRDGKGSPLLARIDQRRQDQALFSKFISTEIEDLKKWYKENGDAFKKGTVTEETRQARLALLREHFAKDVKPHLQTDDYNYFEKMPMNNASLLSLGTYLQDLSDFDRLLKAQGNDLKKFIDFCKTLKSEAKPSQVLKAYLASQEPRDPDSNVPPLHGESEP